MFVYKINQNDIDGVTCCRLHCTCNVIFDIFSPDHSVFFASIRSRWTNASKFYPRRYLNYQTFSKSWRMRAFQRVIFSLQRFEIKTSLDFIEYECISIYFSVRNLAVTLCNFLKSEGKVSQRNMSKSLLRATLYRKLTSVIPTRGIINRNDRVVTRDGQLATLLRGRWIPALISSSSPSSNYATSSYQPASEVRNHCRGRS